MFITANLCNSKPHVPEKGLFTTKAQKYTFIAEIILSSLVVAGGVYFFISNGSSLTGLNAFSTAGLAMIGGGTLIALTDAAVLVCKNRAPAPTSEGKPKTNENEPKPTEDPKPIVSFDEQLDKVLQEEEPRVAKLRPFFDKLKTQGGKIVIEDKVKEEFIKEFLTLYPDTKYYADHGSQGTNEATFDPHVEYQKTMLSNFCLVWIVNNDYEAFVEAQGGNPTKLTKDSFREIRIEWFADWIQSNGGVGIDTLFNVTSDHDLGKLPKLREQWGCPDELDHDKALSIALEKEHPTLTSFAAMRPLVKPLVQKMFKSGFLGPQLVQGESTYDDLIEIVKMLRSSDPADKKAIELMFLQEILDVMGTVVPKQKDKKTPAYNGSCVFDETTFQNFKMLKEVMKMELDFEKSDEELAKEMYLAYYKMRAEDFGIDLDVKNPDKHNLAAIRIGCALRWNGKEKGKEAMMALENFKNQHGEKAYNSLLDSYEKNGVKLEYLPSTLQNANKKGKLIDGLLLVSKMFEMCENDGVFKTDTTKAPVVQVSKIADKVNTDFNFDLIWNDKKTAILPVDKKA